MKRFALAAALLFACSHDTDSLRPRVEDDLGRWLPHLSEPRCRDCVLGACREYGQICLEDRDCKYAVASCVPPNPGCHQSSIPARNFNVCVASTCAEQCELSRSSLACVGDYAWTIPLNGEVAFDLQLNDFGETTFTGQADVTPCSGAQPTCDAAQTVKADTSGPVPVSYAWNIAAARIYFRVTAPELVPLYFYEDAQLTPDYLVNVPTVDATQYALLVSVLGGKADADHGSLSVAAFDCVGMRLPGVELRVRTSAGDDVARDAVAWSFNERNTLRVEDGPPVTRELGQAGYVSLAPGAYDIEGYVDGVRIASIPSVTVQGGALTHVNLFPLTASEAD